MAGRWAASEWTGQSSWQAVPLVGEIVGALEECYDLSDERGRTSRPKRESMQWVTT